MARKDNGNGYILVYRSLLNNEIWISDEPFDKRSAWIDLLLLAQHKNYNGTERGSYTTSQMWLAQRWKWSRGKVNRFLRQLSEQGCVATKCATNGATRGTTITLVNYGKFQGHGTTDGTTDGTSKRATKRTQTNNVLTNNDLTKESPPGRGGRVYE